jgi:ribosomal-protein-alanine N-acetyltransferase
MPDSLPYVVEPMSLADIDQVMEIERVAFSAPWSARAYRFEVADNEHSTMVVVRPIHQPEGWLAILLQRFSLEKPCPLLGYAGFWLLLDEAHICTIAVHPQWRRRGLGELLLLSLLDRAVDLGAHRATLEVRVSNRAAQELYHKYAFEVVSRRRRYYSDNNEDAFIMLSPPFRSHHFRVILHRHRNQLYARLQAEATEETRTLPEPQAS